MTPNGERDLGPHWLGQRDTSAIDHQKLVWKLFIKKLHLNLPAANKLTHWGWVIHICISNLTIIGSDNGLSLARTKPLSEPMLEYSWLDPWEQIQLKSYSKFIHFHSKKMHLKIDGLMQERRNSIAKALELLLSCINPSKCHLWNGGNVVSASMCWYFFKRIQRHSLHQAGLSLAGPDAGHI